MPDTWDKFDRVPPLPSTGRDNFQVAKTPKSSPGISIGLEQGKVVDRRKKFKSAVAVVCLSAILQGWMQSVITTRLTWPNEPEPGVLSSSHPAQWKELFANAVASIIAALTCIVSEPLHRLVLNTRGLLSIAALTSIQASLGSASVISWNELFIWRPLLGVALGITAYAGPIYAAEISPPYLRTLVMMSRPTLNVYGYICGYSIDILAATWLTTSPSRWQAVSISVPALCLFSLIQAVPPPFNAFKGVSLRETTSQASTGIMASQPSTLSAPFSNWFHIVESSGSPHDQQAMKATLTFVIAQQLCLYNAQAFVSNVLIPVDSLASNADRSAESRLVSALASFFLTAHFHHVLGILRRKTLLLFAYPLMMACALAMCITFTTVSDEAFKSLFSYAFSVLTIAYSVKQMFVPLTYFLPTTHQSSGKATVKATNFTITKLFDPMIKMTCIALLILPITAQPFASWGPHSVELIGKDGGSVEMPISVFQTVQMKLFTTIFCFSSTAMLIGFSSTTGTKEITNLETNNGIDAFEHLSPEELNTIFSSSNHALLPRRHLTKALWYVWDLLRWLHSVLITNTRLYRWDGYASNVRKVASHRRHTRSDTGFENRREYDTLGRERKITYRNKHQIPSMQAEAETQMAQSGGTPKTHDPSNASEKRLPDGLTAKEGPGRGHTTDSPTRSDQDEQGLDTVQDDLQAEDSSLACTASLASSSLLSVDVSQSSLRVAIRSAASILVRVFVICVHVQHGQGSARCGQPTSNRTSSVQEVSAAPTGNLGKRKRLSEGDGDDDGLQQQRPTPSPSSYDDNKSPKSKRWACPFHKCNGFLFGVASVEKKYRNCGECSFKDISQLKQHLRRVHYLPDHYCYQCRTSFDDEECLAQHQPQCLPCDPPKHSGKIEPTLISSLKLKTRNKSGFDKEMEWRRIFHGLFPMREDWQTINPYYEGPDQWLMSIFATFCDRQVERVLQEVSRRLEADNPGIAGVLQEVRDLVRGEAMELMRECLSGSQMPQPGRAQQILDGHARPQVQDHDATYHNAESEVLPSLWGQPPSNHIGALFDDVPRLTDALNNLPIMETNNLTESQETDMFMDTLFDYDFTLTWLPNSGSRPMIGTNGEIEGVTLSDLLINNSTDISQLEDAVTAMSGMLPSMQSSRIDDRGMKH